MQGCWNEWDRSQVPSKPTSRPEPVEGCLGRGWRQGVGYQGEGSGQSLTLEA